MIDTLTNMYFSLYILLNIVGMFEMCSRYRWILAYTNISKVVEYGEKD